MVGGFKLVGQGKFQVTLEEVLKRYHGFTRQFDTFEVMLVRDNGTGLPCLLLRMEFRSPSSRMRCTEALERMKESMTQALKGLGEDTFRTWLDAGERKHSGGTVWIHYVLLGENASGLCPVKRGLVISQYVNIRLRLQSLKLSAPIPTTVCHKGRISALQTRQTHRRLAVAI